MYVHERRMSAREYIGLMTEQKAEVRRRFDPDAIKSERVPKTPSAKVMDEAIRTRWKRHDNDLAALVGCSGALVSKYRSEGSKKLTDFWQGICLVLGIDAEAAHEGVLKIVGPVKTEPLPTASSAKKKSLSVLAARFEGTDLEGTVRAILSDLRSPRSKKRKPAT